MSPHKGYRDMGYLEKNIGTRDTEGKIIGIWDIQGELSAQNFLTFQLMKLILKRK